MKLNDQSKCSHFFGNNRRAVTTRVGPAPRQRGQALIELALALPVLLLLTVGIIEFGRVAYYSIEVSDAARVGAQYGAQSMADAANIPNITQAIQNDTQDVPGGINPPTAVLSCVCPGSGSVAGACPAAGCTYPIVYVTVTTTYPLNTLFQYPGIPTTFNLTGVSIMPVQRQ